MRAVVYSRCGTADELRLEQSRSPGLGRARCRSGCGPPSENSWDRDLVRGVPWMSRIAAPVRPEFRILRADVAGVVAAIGGA